MPSRLIFLHHDAGVISEGVTEEARRRGLMNVTLEARRLSGRQIRRTLRPKGDHEGWLRPEPVRRGHAPRKNFVASQYCARTANRHRYPR